ncbi:GNAT family N-acetyltransferase [Bacillus massiliglaciei]|uniref:GNAT family N-acetyltransferase n=1 Tax=Bacillus massiliglaciei TaxID=1816693 RepID=UPI000AC03863|nr:GNAT family N-acetyltransferase [Bacillus massiliglaciei]
MSTIAAITYKVNEAIRPEDSSEIFKGSGIKRPADDLDRLKRMMEHSNLLITAWEQERPIGVARAVTDYAYCCYLSDLAVDRAYQKQGIGKELVRLVQEQIGEETALILLASPAAMDYYPNIGFDKIENGYKIPRLR